jgi:hypothetical protein
VSIEGCAGGENSNPKPDEEMKKEGLMMGADGKPVAAFELGSEEAKQMLPEFFGELQVGAQEMIAEKVISWQKEGKNIDLEASVLILRMNGADSPIQGSVISGAAGVRGQAMGPTVLLDALANALHSITQSAGFISPLQRDDSFRGAAENFMVELAAIAEQQKNLRGLRKLWWRMTGRMEKRMNKAINEYLQVVKHIEETGELPHPPEKPAEASEISTADFEGSPSS